MKKKKQREREVDTYLEAALQQLNSSLETSRRVLGSLSQTLVSSNRSLENYLYPAPPKNSDP